MHSHIVTHYKCLIVDSLLSSKPYYTIYLS